MAKTVASYGHANTIHTVDLVPTLNKTMNMQNEKILGGFLQDEEIDLRQYWLTVMRYRGGILGLAIVVTLLTLLVVFSMDPIYRATATLLVESNEAKVVSIEEVYGLDSSRSEYYQTQFEILKSRSLAEKVIDKHQLVSHPEFNRESTFDFDWRDWVGKILPDLAPQVPTEQQILQAKADAFIERLTIEPIRKTQLVNINFDAYEPEFAAQIANAVGDAFIENNLEAKLELTIKASSWLNERMGGLKEKLKESEQRLQEFRDQEEIIGDRGGFDIANTELDLVAEKLVDARRERLNLQSIYSEVSALGDNPSVADYERIPAVLAHPVVQKHKESLLAVEQKQSELAKRYGPKHPKMLAVESELAGAENSLQRQIKSIVRGIENQYRVAANSERSMERALGGSKKTMQVLKRKEYQLNELEQEVKTNRDLYDTFFTRLNETSATGNLASANARISDPAVAPLKPAKPKKGLITALSFVVSLMFGVMCAFLLEALNNTVRSTADVQEKLGQTMLGLLPELDKKELQKNDADTSYSHYIEDRQSGFAEAVRTIRTGLVLSSLDNPYKTIAVTSTMPGEGKTTLALSLAYALGQTGKVLLIDADMRRPSIGKLFQFGSKAPGLSNLVAGSATVEDCLHTMQKEGIDVMSAGIIPPNPLELLSSKSFTTTLKSLAENYDQIIIDCPPCQAVSDALVLAPLVDSIIYVVKADSTPVPQIKAGLKRMEDARARITGIVINRLDLEKASRYYGEGYSGYYDVYGYSADSKA